MKGLSAPGPRSRSENTNNICRDSLTQAGDSASTDSSCATHRIQRTSYAFSSEDLLSHGSANTTDCREHTQSKLLWKPQKRKRLDPVCRCCLTSKWFYNFLVLDWFCFGGSGYQVYKTLSGKDPAHSPGCSAGLGCSGMEWAWVTQSVKRQLQALRSLAAGIYDLLSYGNLMKLVPSATPELLGKYLIHTCWFIPPNRPWYQSLLELFYLEATSSLTYRQHSLQKKRSAQPASPPWLSLLMAFQKLCWAQSEGCPGHTLAANYWHEILKELNIFIIF